MFKQYEMGDQSRQMSYPVMKTKQTTMLPFSVTGMGDFTCDNRYFTRRWGLEQGLIIYTIDGEGIVEYEGKKTGLTAGQLIVLDCRKYQYYATQGDSWHFLWIHFEGKCAFDYIDLLNAEDANPLYLGNRISFSSYFEKIRTRVAHFNLQSELELSAVLLNLLTDLIHLKKMEDFSLKYGGYRKELEMSIAYMQEHFREAISVKHLADLCHLSKYYYIKIFKAYTGQAPYEYLLSFRLQQSQKMLLETGKTVGEIAMETGFADNKNFIACFKKKVGITPLQYRKKNSLVHMEKEW